MGSDDLFKKKRAKLQQRKKETLTPKPNSFLIVSEGAKTEPLYFDGLAKYINEKYGQNIDVEKPTIDTQGEGKCTVSLVREAQRIASRAPIMYSQVWVVFDKDDFDDFDEAIDLAEQFGFHVAWSNQSFEYWIYLHFNHSDSALHRDVWVNKLDELFKNRGISKTGYQKNDPDIFDIVREHGSLRAAVNSATRMENFFKGTRKASQCDPCTTVHHLILALRPYISELL